MGRQGRVVVPVEVREALGLKPGSVLTFTVSQGSVVVTTPRGAARELQKLFATVPRAGGPLASEELIEERRVEATRESERS